MKTRIFHWTLLVLSLTALSACQTPTQRAADKPDRQWVYIEVVTTSPSDTTDYFYFGEMRRSLLEDIDFKENKTGLFTLYNIRYWNQQDLLQVYENVERQGDRVFKIEDIEEITNYKGDPIMLFNPKELHESALRIREQLENRPKKKPRKKEQGS